MIDQLGIRPTAPMRPGAAPAAAGPPRRQFILPLEDPACETSINNIITGGRSHVVVVRLTVFKLRWAGALLC